MGILRSEVCVLEFLQVTLEAGVVTVVVKGESHCETQQMQRRPC